MLSTNHPSTPHLTHVKHTKYDIKGVVWFHFCIVFYDFVVRKHYRNNFHIKSVCSVYSIHYMYIRRLHVDFVSIFMHHIYVSNSRLSLKFIFICFIVLWGRTSQHKVSYWMIGLLRLLSSCSLQSTLLHLRSITVWISSFRKFQTFIK